MVKGSVKLIIDKLLFRDIQADDDNKTSAKIRLQKTLALTFITVILVAGSFLTASYALNYYRGIRDEFLKDTEPPQQPEAVEPSGVWFTQELGDPHQIQGILAYLDDYRDEELAFNVVNVNDIPIELVSVQDVNGKYVYPIPGDTLLAPTADYESHSFTISGIDTRMLEVRSEIYINYKYDDGILRQALLNPFKRIDEDIFSGTSIRTQDNMASFAFVRENDQYVFFDGDHITINKPLYIPGGKTLRLSAGQEIDLVNGAFMVVRAPVHFEGTQEQVISIHTSDGTGRGLVVMGADTSSIVSYTVFDGLDTPSSGIWTLTGAVTFYESDVDIAHSQFINNVSEDGLNIVRSTFSMVDVYFGNTASDAFDSDFSIGTISDSTFENTTNDAIDVSGTQIEITNTKTRWNGDKGISAGENSRIHVQKTSIDNAVIGIASKDLSQVTGDDITVSNTRIALTLYIKKPEYGPAQMDLTNFIMQGNIDIDYLIQPKSTLVIDGKVIRPRAAAKESLLFEKIINGEQIQ